MILLGEVRIRSLSRKEQKHLKTRLVAKDVYNYAAWYRNTRRVRKLARMCGAL